jgi:hypothetical protein
MSQLAPFAISRRMVFGLALLAALSSSPMAEGINETNSGNI